MSVTIILKGRQKDPDGHPAWHDRYAFAAGLRAIIRKKNQSFHDNPIWYNLAARIERAGEAIQFGMLGEPVLGLDGKATSRRYVNLPDIPVSISPAQARHLWRELSDLPGEAFFDVPKCPNCGFGGSGPTFDPGMLNIMLQDLSEQLGEKFPLEDDEE